MKIGIDYNGVITTNTPFFRTLISKMKAEWVCLTVSNDDVEKLLSYSGIRIPVFRDNFSTFYDVPRQKYELAKQAGVDLVIDDMQEVVDYLNQRDIKAIRWQ